MAVTININGLSLCHKGSGGLVKSTPPDVCKTPMPGGPVPIPYSIISFSKDLVKGTKTINVDGGNMAANLGSEFSCCVGDEPGTVKGVASGTQLKEATWMTYSPNVFFEDKAACRLSDKMFMNHKNTVSMGGLLQPHLVVLGIPELQTLCDMMCDVKDQPGPKQSIIAAKLQARDAAMGGNSTMKAEVPFNPNTVEPYMSRNDPTRATTNWFIPGHRRPDVVITDGGPPVRENIRAVVEMKFNDADTPFSAEQRRAYQDMFGEDFVEMEEGKDCICEDDDNQETEPVTEPVPAPAQEPDTSLNTAELLVVGGVLGVAAVAALLFPFDGPVGEAALGSAALRTFGLAFGF